MALQSPKSTPSFSRAAVYGQTRKSPASRFLWQLEGPFGEKRYASRSRPLDSEPTSRGQVHSELRLADQEIPGPGPPLRGLPAESGNGGFPIPDSRRIGKHPVFLKPGNPRVGNPISRVATRTRASTAVGSEYTPPRVSCFRRFRSSDARTDAAFDSGCKSAKGSST